MYYKRDYKICDYMKIAYYLHNNFTMKPILIINDLRFLYLFHNDFQRSNCLKKSLPSGHSFNTNFLSLVTSKDTPRFDV